MMKAKKRRWAYVVLALALLLMVCRLQYVQPRLGAEVLCGDLPEDEVQFVLVLGSGSILGTRYPVEGYRFEGERLVSMGIAGHLGHRENKTYSAERMALEGRLNWDLGLQQQGKEVWWHSAETQLGGRIFYAAGYGHLYAAWIDQERVTRAMCALPLPEKVADAEDFCEGFFFDGKTLCLMTDNGCFCTIDMTRGELTDAVRVYKQNILIPDHPDNYYINGFRML